MQASVVPMDDTVIDAAWTVDRFLAWEDRQEGKHEFDGYAVIPMTGGTAAHQRIVWELVLVLLRVLEGSPHDPLHEMRVRCGTRVRYSDVVVSAAPVEQSTRTLDDAVAIFEILSADTATTDRVDKLIDYAVLPSLRCYVLLEQTAMAATVFQREPGGPWIATAHTGGVLELPALDVTLPLADIYRRVSFN